MKLIIKRKSNTTRDDWKTPGFRWRSITLFVCIGTICVVGIRKNVMTVSSVSKATIPATEEIVDTHTQREREREKLVPIQPEMLLANSSAEDVTEDSLTRHDAIAIDQEQDHDNPTAQAEKDNGQENQRSIEFAFKNTDPGVRAKECSLGKKWEPRANHDYKCPTAWPLPSNAVGCCNAAIDSVTYTRASNNSWCETYEQQLRAQGASLLQGKHIFFIGDSVGHHWLNAMLLDAHSSKPSLFPTERSTWSEFYNKSTSFFEYDERGFCAFPFQFLNMSSAWASAPTIVSAIYPNSICPPPYKKPLYNQCCPRGIPISATGAISAKLNETKPDIVIAQMGVHWHAVPRFQTEMREMVTALGNYSALNPNSLVLFLESLPQHFDMPDGSYDGLLTATNRSKFTCLPLNSSRIQSDLLKPLGDSMSVGMHNFNQLARSTVESTEGVQWLPANSGAIAARPDAHQGATNCCARHTDCTHYCYSPHLWQPAIDPFYLAMDSWLWSSDQNSTHGSSRNGLL